MDFHVFDIKKLIVIFVLNSCPCIFLFFPLLQSFFYSLFLISSLIIQTKFFSASNFLFHFLLLFFNFNSLTNLFKKQETISYEFKFFSIKEKSFQKSFWSWKNPFIILDNQNHFCFQDIYIDLDLNDSKYNQSISFNKKEPFIF
jgi:hypothetical protein